MFFKKIKLNWLFKHKKLIFGVLALLILSVGFWYSFWALSLTNPSANPPTGGGAFKMASGGSSNTLAAYYVSSTASFAFSKTWTTSDDFLAATSSPSVIISSGMWLKDNQLSLLSNFGTGIDGAVTISGATNLNTWNHSGRTCADGGDAVSYSVTALTSNTATLSASPSSGCLNLWDELLLINLQGYGSSYTNVGNYEHLRVKSVNGAVVTFFPDKTKYYGNGASDDTNIGTATSNQRVMLMRLPNYTSATVSNGVSLTASAWNGVKNGILAFKTNSTALISGSLNVNTLGYRGGVEACATGGPGYAGESYCYNPGGGNGGNVYGGAGSAGTCGGGGGGAAPDYETYTSGGAGSAIGGAGGGAGGGFASSGSGGSAGYGTRTDGSTSQASGAGTSGRGWHDQWDDWYYYSGSGGMGGTYGVADLSKLIFGSGGGGAGNEGVCSNQYGGYGAGIVYLTGQTVTVSGSILSNGASGSCDGGACGGNSSGGSVLLKGSAVTLGSNLVQATGPGGSANSAGRIAVGGSVSGTTNPTYTSVSGALSYYPSGESSWTSEMVSLGGGSKFKPSILNSAWVLDGTDNIAPKIQLQGSDSVAFAGEQTCYPAGCSSYWQDGGTYDINNSVNLNISSQVTQVFNYWKVKVIIDTGSNLSDTPLLSDIKIESTQSVVPNPSLGIGRQPSYVLDVVSAGTTTARFGTASGDALTIGGGTGKLTVGTVDPVYEINGEKYATYVPGMIGQREEFSGTLKLPITNYQLPMKYSIDFDNLEKGSDLWLFRKIVDFGGKDWQFLSVLVSPKFSGRVWYEKNPSANQLVFYASPTENWKLEIGNSQPEISFRLSAPRFDWRSWGNLNHDQSLTGFKIK